ncbi:hypothetical protein GCM10010440_62000 [Kitasatospora cinereorecta]
MELWFWTLATAQTIEMPAWERSSSWADTRSARSPVGDGELVALDCPDRVLFPAGDGGLVLLGCPDGVLFPPLLPHPAIEMAMARRTALIGAAIFVLEVRFASRAMGSPGGVRGCVIPSSSVGPNVANGIRIRPAAALHPPSGYPAAPSEPSLRGRRPAGEALGGVLAGLGSGMSGGP